MDGDLNDIVISSNHGKSFLNKEHGVKTLPLGTAPLKRSKQSSISAKFSSTVTSLDKEKQSGVSNNEKPWSSVVASCVDLPCTPRYIITSSKNTFDHATSFGNQSNYLDGAVWSDPQLY